MEKGAWMRLSITSHLVQSSLEKDTSVLKVTLQTELECTHSEIADLLSPIVVFLITEIPLMREFIGCTNLIIIV